MEKMIGKCTFEVNEPRASKNSWTFERFMLLQKVNNLSYSDGKEKYILTSEQSEVLINLAYTQKEIKYEKIRKMFELPENTTFLGLDYSARKSKKQDSKIMDEKEVQENGDNERKAILKSAENVTFVKLIGYHSLKDEFKMK